MTRARTWRRDEGGITLIEIIVSLTVIMMIAMALTVAYRRLPSTALRQDATRMAAVLRAGYDHAAASNVFHRLVLDLDERTYHLERCEGKLELRHSADQKEEEDARKAEAEARAREAASGINGQSPMQAIQAELDMSSQLVGGAAGGTGAATCKAIKGEMGKPQTLGGSPKVSFGKVYISHYDQPVTTGKVQINFFPMGRAERAVIELSAGDDPVPETWSVGLHPFSGRVEVHNGAWKGAADFVSQDAEGKRVEP